MSNVTKLFTSVLALVIVVAVFAAPSMAQDVANGQATATVQTPLTVLAPNDLQFGTVYQGVYKSVANNVADAGMFTITGTSGAGISVYMQLPDYMSLSDGSDRMVIAFSSTDCSVDTTGAGDPTLFGAGWQNTDPHNLPSGVIIGGTSGETDIYLGGSVYPTVDQAAGAYAADIILTVAYNGS